MPNEEAREPAGEGRGTPSAWKEPLGSQELLLLGVTAEGEDSDADIDAMAASVWVDRDRGGLEDTAILTRAVSEAIADADVVE